MLIPKAYALELTFQDTTAGVDVAPAFSLSLDKSNIDFGLIQPGERSQLYEGKHFNEIVCRSNHGKTWQLKAQLITPIMHSAKNIEIPSKNFRWRVLHSDGQGQVANKNQFNDFSTTPGLIYISSGTDNRGKEVKLEFQYEFETPQDALAGRYNAQILFTLTEEP